MAKSNARLWQMSPAQYQKHMDRKRERLLRECGFSSSSPWANKYQRKSSLWKRPDKVRDPKSAFFYLHDNVMSENGGKLLNSFHGRGHYFWYERSRGADQAYFFVQKRGNYMVVTRTRYVVAGKGINTFITGLTGIDEEPTVEHKVILRHPIMDVQGFKAAYRAAAPELEWFDWED